jgi:hypothetical protein
LVADFRIFGPLSTVSVSDSDRRKPKSASTSARIERRIWSGKVRFVADLETRCGWINHPCRQAGERAIGLEKNDELDAPAFEPPSDLHHFAEARMIAVGNPSFSRLFVGSMSPF